MNNCIERFDKNYTWFIKGVAILIMILHHVMYVKLNVPIKTWSSSEIVFCITKVCVAIFTILSGYGMAKSFKIKSNDESNRKFVFRHIKKVMFGYWWVYVPFFILSFFLNVMGTPYDIFGTGITGIINFLFDFLGISGFFYTSSINDTWWYIETILILYLLFPVFYMLIEKKAGITLIISIIPCILYDIGYSIPCIYNGNREIFYIFPFLLGILLANRDYLNKLILYCEKIIENKVLVFIVSIFCILIFSVITTQLYLFGCTLLAFSIIIFLIVIKSYCYNSSFIFECLGKNSFNMYLVHVFFQFELTFFMNIFFAIPNTILRYIYLVIISFFTSIVINKSRQIFKKLYDSVIQKK